MFLVCLPAYLKCPYIFSQLSSIWHNNNLLQCHSEICVNEKKLERRFSVTQIELFGDLVQDKNILHSPPKSWEEAVLGMPHLQAVQDAGLMKLNECEDGSNTTTMKPLVHGIFVSSLFSSIFGSLSPGCVYMNQTLHFAHPVFAEELVLARIDIEKIRKWRRGGVVVQCQTKALLVYDENNCTCTKDAVTGVANVWLPSGYQVSSSKSKTI